MEDLRANDRGRAGMPGSGGSDERQQRGAEEEAEQAGLEEQAASHESVSSVVAAVVVVFVVFCRCLHIEGRPGLRYAHYSLATSVLVQLKRTPSVVTGRPVLQKRHTYGPQNQSTKSLLCIVCVAQKTEGFLARFFFFDPFFALSLAVMFRLFGRRYGWFLHVKKEDFEAQSPRGCARSRRYYWFCLVFSSKTQRFSLYYPERKSPGYILPRVNELFTK